MDGRTKLLREAIIESITFLGMAVETIDIQGYGNVMAWSVLNASNAVISGRIEIVLGEDDAWTTLLYKRAVMLDLLLGSHRSGQDMGRILSVLATTPLRKDPQRNTMTELIVRAYLMFLQKSGVKVKEARSILLGEIHFAQNIIEIWKKP